MTVIHTAYERVLELMTGGADFGDALDHAAEQFAVDWDELADYYTAAELPEGSSHE